MMRSEHRAIALAPDPQYPAIPHVSGPRLFNTPRRRTGGGIVGAEGGEKSAEILAVRAVARFDPMTAAIPSPSDPEAFALPDPIDRGAKEGCVYK
jgi:hypothetical protein